MIQIDCLRLLHQSNPSTILSDLKSIRDLMTDVEQQRALLEQFLENSEFFHKEVLGRIRQYVIEASEYQLPLFYMQFLCNFVTNNQPNKDYLCAQLNNQELSFYENLTNEKIQRCCWMFVYNMLKNNPQRELLLFDHSFFTPLTVKLLQSTTEQVEWSTYFLNEVFNADTTLQRSYLAFIGIDCIYYLMFHLLSKTIDERQTPTLIADIREMYQEQKKLGIVISQLDLVYLQQQYKSIQQRLLLQFIDPQNEQFNQLVESQTKLLKIFCLVTFMGGFNKQIQDCMVDSYVLVLDLMVQMKTVYHDGSLKRLLERETYEDVLSVFLRFIGNMVHLHPQAQQILLTNGSYVKCALGLTKIDDDQSQMREWSAVLIRNLAEGAPNLKDIIAQHMQ